MILYESWYFYYPKMDEQGAISGECVVYSVIVFIAVNVRNVAKFF